jgi:hypothetical protein
VQEKNTNEADKIFPIMAIARGPDSRLKGGRHLAQDKGQFLPQQHILSHRHCLVVKGLLHAALGAAKRSKQGHTSGKYGLTTAIGDGRGGLT